ncbi:hypothetical protein AB852_17425 [Streptomyces uncialis]|uniref:Uncharacterized protein n=1 Tax=Streptomyces uncialis TaxID=1048205 RepID=A0A1Q4V7K1_9ACTN|nr:hypothetical protein AB852_17425 [Streptomyces uncialis]
MTEAANAESDGRKRLDLSVPQVAGSAVAAVVAAKLASNVGVYGTIIGAGLVSIVATCGGSVFQHFFARTGERVRGAAVQSMPRARQVPFPGGPEGVPGDPDPTRVIDTRDPARAQVPGPARTQLLAAVDPEATARFGTAGPGHPPAGDTPTRLLGTVRPSHPHGDRADRGGGPYGPHDGDGVGGDEYEEYGESTVHRARTRRWKRPLIAAAVVFGVTMGGITTYELVSGETFSGGGKGTTIGEAVTGDSGRGARPDDPAPAPEAPAEEPSGSPGQDSTDGGEDTDRDGDGGTDPTAPTPEGDPGTGGQQSERPSDEPSTEPEPSTGQDGGPGTATPPGTGTGSTPPPAPTPSPSTGGPTQSVPEQRQGTTPSP